MSGIDRTYSTLEVSWKRRLNRLHYTKERIIMKVEHSIGIEAPLDLVWDKISRLTDIQHWTRTVTEAHVHTEVER